MGSPAKATGSGSERPASRVGKYQQATTKKLSISLEAEAHEWLTGVAAAEGRSVSAVISDIVNATRRFRATREWLDEVGTEDITPELQAEVDAELRAAGVIK